MLHQDKDQEEDSQADLLPHKESEPNQGKTKTPTATPDDEKAAKKKKIIKWAIIGAIIVIIVTLAIVLPIVLTRKNNNPDNPQPTPYNPPFPPGYNIYQVNPEDMVTATSEVSGIIRAPSTTSVSGVDSSTSQDKSAIIEILQSLYSDSNKYFGGYSNKTITQGVNNHFTQNVSFTFAMTSWRIARLIMTDDDHPKYSIPDEVLNLPSNDGNMRLDMQGFSIKTSPFSFKFVDPLDTNAEHFLVSTENQTLVFMDKFIQMDFVLPSQRIFGFGERIHEFQLSEGAWTMWANGKTPQYDDGSGKKSTYGVHPFILIQGNRKDDFIGMYFRNSEAQTPVLKYNDKGQALLSYITIGGVLDVYFYMHGSAKDVMKWYQGQFGTPSLPPYWALGWHQSSYKWKNQSMVEDVIQKYKDNDFPLDAIYLDIPYMKDGLDFTVNTDNFSSMYNLTQNLHNNKQYLVLILDGDIIFNTTYYVSGNNSNVFIKSGQWTSEKYSSNLINDVYGRQCVYIDWFNSNSTTFWENGLLDLYNQVEFDGLWLDMNEPTSFVDGESKPEDAQNITQEQVVENKLREARFLLGDDINNLNYDWYSSFPQDSNSTWYLPFIPNMDNTGNYDAATLSLNATHLSNNLTEYDLHNLYGHMMIKRTSNFLKNNNNYNKTGYRPFILSRSTFTSSGGYASHWLGDNLRNWDFLKYSISGIMNMNLLGVPHTGADICGFDNDDSINETDELCARWVQLATFYPFARFHFDETSNETYPFLLKDQYQEIAKQSMQDRYQYLRLLYTCMYEVSINGGSCFDPLFYHFPTDDNVYNDIDSSFIFGNTLKVSPILTNLSSDQTSFQSYFPQGQWVNLVNQSEIINSDGEQINLSTQLNSINVHLMPGKLIPFQDNSDNSVKKVADLEGRGISLLANRDQNGHAYGSVLLAKGQNSTEIDWWQHEYYQLHVQNNSIQFFLNQGNRGSQKDNHYLSEIKIFNATDLAAVSAACYLDQDLKPHGLLTSFDENLNILTITSDSNKLRFHEFHSIHYTTYGEISVCDINTFAYQLVNSTLPDLSSTTNATFLLKHMLGKLPNINMTLRTMPKNIINIYWTWETDENGNLPQGKKQPFEVPEDIVNTTIINGAYALGEFIYIENVPKFRIAYYDKGLQNQDIFSIEGFVFDSYLNWINARVHVDSGDNFTGIFGLGERANKDFFFDDGVYTMWNRDNGTPDETGSLPAANMYGTHPFFMFKRTSNIWMGVFYKLAQGQDWWIKNNKTQGTVDISTVATGGVGDIYIMRDTTPDGVVKKFFSFIGNPVLVPQWSLGWQQCKYGYHNTSDVQNAVNGYQNFSIPLDVMWTDIDYMNKYRNFEYDTDAFKDLDKLIDNLHQSGRKYIPILDAGVAMRPKQDYQLYNDGDTKGVFMKIGGDRFVGQVWPNDAAFPDYFNDQTAAWWQSGLSSLHDKLAFDGLWHDMNEASNFCNGVCYPYQKVQDSVRYNLKYVPGGRDLDDKSMSVDAIHANGYYQIDTHNIYGTQMVKTSSDWFTSNNKRTFIIERSSFTGMGKYGSKWLGDNSAESKYMSYSVTGIMLMNIFGIPMTGSDICGFAGNTTPLLCTRWHYVGAFYPFSRNHYVGDQIHEPQYFNGTYIDGNNVVDLMRTAIKVKYALIKYYYTNLFLISTITPQSTQRFATLYKPLFFEFPDDMNAYQNITRNVMLGQALKLSLNADDEYQNMTDYYFPSALWCGILGTDIGTCFNSNGQVKTYTSKAYEYQLHLRHGYIVPMQDTLNTSVKFNNSVDLQSIGIQLHVLGQSTNDDKGYWSAQGNYVNDDGVTLDYTNNYNSYSISAVSNSNFTVSINLTATAQTQNVDPNCTAVNQNDYLEKIYFYNADNYNNNVSYSVNASLQNTSEVFAGNATYDSTTNRLVFVAAEPLCLSTIIQLIFSKI